MMPAVCLNGLQAGADDLNNLVFAKANQLGQRGSHTFLIVRNQDAHTAIPDLSMRIESFPADDAIHRKSPCSNDLLACAPYLFAIDGGYEEVHRRLACLRESIGVGILCDRNRKNANHQYHDQEVSGNGSYIG